MKFALAFLFVACLAMSQAMSLNSEERALKLGELMADEVKFMDFNNRQLNTSTLINTVAPFFIQGVFAGLKYVLGVFLGPLALSFIPLLDTLQGLAINAAKA